MSHALGMQLASTAQVGRWTLIGALAVAVPAALLATRGGEQVSVTEQVLYVPTEPNCTGLAIPAAADPVPDDARYLSVDLDGDGVDELVAETASGRKAIVFRVRDGAPAEVATIDLVTPAHPCKAELAIRGNRLVVQEYEPPALGDSSCAATTVRTFQLTPAGLAPAVVDK